MSVCAAFLTAARRVAIANKTPTDRACGVLEDGFGGFVVESYEGKIVWQGDAHCKYCARAEAISKMADESASPQCTLPGVAS